MSLVLNLPPDLESNLAAEAHNKGMSLSEYISEFLIVRQGEDLWALQKLARITPSNDVLRALAATSPPPPEWIDGDNEEQLLS